MNENVTGVSGASRETAKGLPDIQFLLRFGALIAQVVLVAVMFRALHLESEAFRQILYLTAVAFPINHLLPLRFRLPFFSALSLSATVLILGAPSAIWLIGIGLVFIGLCHLPAPKRVRVALVVLAALALAVFRAGWLESPWPGTIWPILGAMFMFRMIVYVYDLTHDSAPFSPSRALAYFFMIPNVCFPLFPVVDYQTFCKTYYNDDAFKIYQTGIKWMVRGGIQLVIYRILYKFMIVGPAEIEGASGFFQHMVCTYLLYLQVSGIFHTIVGLLHLFGFNLPECNHHYVLASSFTDFWRRINIYWKDFMMKVFFYPLFFRLRKLGTTQGMIYATLITFFVTWALHAYQWFWLRGSALFTTHDIIFWVALGLLVTVSVWNESRPRKKLVPKTTADSVRLAAILARNTVATFLTITFLWSLWTADSLGEWQATLLQLKNWDLAAVLKIALVLGFLSATAIVVGRDQWMVGGAAKRRAAQNAPYDFWRAAVLASVPALLVTAVSIYAVQRHMGPTFVAFMKAIEHPSLNAHDAAEMQRGYYEDLIQVDRFNAELQAMYSKQPPNYFDEWRAVMNIKRDDFLGVDMAPSASITYEGVTYTTNEWNMRDKSYTLEKPEGVRRVGLIGSSHMMGWGIADSAVFDAIAEDRLNAEGRRIELLNFSVNGFSTLQMAMLLEERMLTFDLDSAVLLYNRTERQRIVTQLAKLTLSGGKTGIAELDEIVEKSQVSPDMSEPVIRIRLSAYREELALWTLRRFVSLCHERGIDAVFVFTPDARGNSAAKKEVRETVALANEAGFDLVLDYTDVYDGHDEKKLVLSEYDEHANAFAHGLLAARLYESIVNNEAVFTGSDSGSPVTQTPEVQ